MELLEIVKQTEEDVVGIRDAIDQRIYELDRHTEKLQADRKGLKALRDQTDAYLEKSVEGKPELI